MFIIWGKKQVTRSLGYAADFCPICRDLRTFEIKRIGIAGHIYHVSLGEGELVGHIRTCAVCDVDLNAKPENYKEIHHKSLPPHELAALTYPGWQQAYAARLAIEKELASPASTFSPQDRLVLIKEPFVLLAPKVEAQVSTVHIDGPTCIAAAGLIVLVVIASAIADRFPAASQIVYLAAWIIGLAAVGVQLCLINGRFFRNKILPVLVPALLPLKPTPAELEAVLKELKASGRKIGQKLDVTSLVTALKEREIGIEVVASSNELKALYRP